jgi:hypothetical protein
MTDGFPDPLGYLNRVERFLVGWSVVRLFETNRPRTAKWLQRSGPHAVARVAASQTFGMYIWLGVLPGVAFEVAGLPQVATVLYALAGVSAVWAGACVISAIRPERAYRREQGRNRLRYLLP